MWLTTCRCLVEQVPPHTGLSLKQGRRTATCPTSPDLAFLLGRDPALPCVPRLRIMPPCSGGLGRCHVPRGFGSCLSAREGSGVATCPAAPDPASLLGRALALPHVPRLWILPPCSRGLQRCHVSHGTGPRLPAWEGSSAVMCPRLSVGHRPQE
jgi:hypothetical protein